MILAVFLLAVMVAIGAAAPVEDNDKVYTSHTIKYTMENPFSSGI